MNFSYIFQNKKTTSHREFIFFNLIKIKVKRKGKEKVKQFFYEKILNAINYTNFCYANSLNLKNKTDYIPMSENLFEREDKDIKLIAFYLPQYHTIPINDKFHGKGFTDWRNVSSSIPHFPGHYQPQLPSDCGFYDLSNPKILEEQSKIAQQYGIYGFCYHYYWFSGERLLEKPLFDMLNNSNVTIPYCLCWANENWSKLWDGGNKELIKEQKLQDEDDKKFFYDILPFFKDPRYIKIDNKPVLVIYRPNLFSQERFKKFVDTLRFLAKENDFKDLYLISSNFTLQSNPQKWNMDAILEFPPHGLYYNGLKENKNIAKQTNPNFNGKIFDMIEYVNNKRYLYDVKHKLFKGIFPSWDNSARKAYSNASVYYGLSPDLYKIWLKDITKWTNEHNEPNEQFIFINAWNEWAEGAHLEADLKYGYTYLQATREALEELR